MRNKPGFLIAVGVVIVVGLILLGAKYGPRILGNNDTPPPVTSVDPSPTEPGKTSPPVEPVDPEPEKQNPYRNARTPSVPGQDGLSNKKMGCPYPKQ